ncbi:MAG TPA: alkane 1-monooxygenase [Azospirillaceae bacterium]|nr:alkane 1-monooxygenase [Azospirillaceae bacterium]
MAALIHGLCAFLVPGLAFAGLWLGGPWLFMPLAWTSGVAVALDFLLPARQGRAAGRDTWASAFPTWFIFPVMAALLLFALFQVTARELAWWEWVGAATAVGVTIGGIGIPAAHELVHRRHAFERGLGVAIVSLVLYAHFRIEHVHGHHRRVGTAEDPATARFGHSLYRFMTISVPGEFTSAWELEKERLERRGMKALHWRNRMIWYVAGQAALVAAIAWAFGPAGVLFFLGQAAVAIQLLQATAYIEHYGLERGRSARGGWDRIEPWHSWNSGHRVTNWTTFNLGLHAEHHRWPGKAWPELVDDDRAMHLPYGYPFMIMLAMLPPLWFRVMDPRVRPAPADPAPVAAE